MRVAHISTQKNWGGGEKQVLYLLQNLHKWGLTQTLFCLKGSALAERSKNEAWETVEFAHPLLLPRERAIRERATRERGVWGGEGTVAPPGDEPGHSNDLPPIDASTAGQKKGFDLIHTHDSKALTFALLAMSMSMSGKKKTPIINTCRMIKKPGWFSHIKFSHPAIRKHICISHAVMESMRSFIKSPDKLTLIPSGIDLHHESSAPPPAHLRQSFGIPEDAFLVISVGALTRQKRPDFFLEIVQKLLVSGQNEKRPLHFLLVGEGPLRGTLERMVSERGLGKVCRLSGFTPHASALIQLADLLVSTAVDEALGNVIMEAFAAQTPVVASHSGGVGDLVEHGRTGFLASPKEVDEFAAYCCQIIENRKLARAFCVNALEKIEKFDIVSVCKDVLALYSQCQE
ncbi:MAG: glycosyltransferase family 4 protein [Deltaproteobacteria bacterium]|nr:glycosyltransferase family 4 protein [Deltaproteobacteria bacterium]